MRLADRHTCSLLLAFILFADPAAAQQPTQAQANAVRQSCRSDYQTYCANVPSGGRASLQCLQTHLNELSPPCADAVGAATGGAQSHPPATSTQAAPPATPPASMAPREKIALMRRACGADFRTYCRDVPLGGGQALACLSQNESRLSTRCRDALAEARASR